MVRRNVITLALAATLSSSAVYALPLPSIFHKDSAATASTGKVDVAFNNTSELPRQIKVGGKIKTLTSHKITHMEIPAGTTVTVYSAMKTHNPGDVLIVVDASHPTESVTVD
jgi:hypothetical protein